MENQKFIIDTDIGSDIDDTLCFAYLFEEARCEILGITTTSSEPWKRAEIVDTMCRAAGKEIPVFPGLDNPIIGKQRQIAVHQYSVVDKLPHKAYSKENRAIEFMKRAIEENPGEVILLAIGPLTNVGALFAAYPHLAKLVKLEAIMGGSFFEAGRALLRQEWNVINDPYAAQIVFKSGANILVVPLDVSIKTLTSAKEFLSKEHSGVMKTVAVYTEKFTERTDEMYYHDVIPAMLVFEKQIAEIKCGEVSIDLTDEIGRSDFSENESGNVEMVVDFDVDRFFEIYKTTVNEK